MENPSINAANWGGTPMKTLHFCPALKDLVGLKSQDHRIEVAVGHLAMGHTETHVPSPASTTGVRLKK